VETLGAMGFDPDDPEPGAKPEEDQRTRHPV